MTALRLTFVFAAVWKQAETTATFLLYAFPFPGSLRGQSTLEVHF